MKSVKFLFTATALGVLMTPAAMAADNTAVPTAPVETAAQDAPLSPAEAESYRAYYRNTLDMALDVFPSLFPDYVKLWRGLEPGECYILLNTQEIMLRPSETRPSFDIDLNQFSVQIKQTDGTPDTMNPLHIRESFDSADALGQRYGTALAFPKYTAVGCFTEENTAQRHARLLNDRLVTNLLTQIEEKLQAGSLPSPAPSLPAAPLPTQP